MTLDIQMDKKKIHRGINDMTIDLTIPTIPSYVNTPVPKYVDTKPEGDKAKRTAPGYKEDRGKLRYDLLSPYALDELAKVSTYGAEKYTDNNWLKGIKWGRVFAAVMRHLWLFWGGERKDQESGIDHLSHAMWGMMALIEYSRNDTYASFDDRAEPKKLVKN